MRYLRKIWAFNEMSSDAQADRKRSFIDKHLCRTSWQYRHFLLFERKTQICRELMINRLMHRTHIKFDNSICEDALRSWIDVENDERTLRKIIITKENWWSSFSSAIILREARQQKTSKKVFRKIKKKLKLDEQQKLNTYYIYVKITVYIL
jgi:hypothetical protein